MKRPHRTRSVFVKAYLIIAVVMGGVGLIQQLLPTMMYLLGRAPLLATAAFKAADMVVSTFGLIFVLLSAYALYVFWRSSLSRLALLVPGSVLVPAVLAVLYVLVSALMGGKLLNPLVAMLWWIDLGAAMIVFYTSAYLLWKGRLSQDHDKRVLPH